MSIISVRNVFKEYKVHEQQKGAVGTLKSFIKPKIKYVQAVKDMSFEIQEGDFVGFIGENGAGKSTMIKMMSGILFPTSGEISVCGLTPYKKRKENAMSIGVVFGQRSRLIWDLAMMDTFLLYKEIYLIDDATFKKNVDMFVELLNMTSYASTPVRQLSLGQRMRAEIALALLHDPKIIYLDEPTIGLDVVAKKHIRDFFRELNSQGRTIILTSHDMKDLDAVSKRLIMINKGELMFDGTTEQLREQYTEETVVEFTFVKPVDSGLAARLSGNIDTAGHKLTVTFDPKVKKLPEIIGVVSESGEIDNMEIRMPDIEDIVRGIYK